MDHEQLLKNLAHVRPEIEWHVTNDSCKNAAAAVNIDIGVCAAGAGSIFGSSHIALHETLHAKGCPKKDVLDTIGRNLASSGTKKEVLAILWLLEELRVEKIVMDKGYSSPPDRISCVNDLHAAAVAELWGLEVPIPSLLKHRASRLAELIKSESDLPTTPDAVAWWLRTIAPKALAAIKETAFEKILHMLSNLFYLFPVIALRLIRCLKKFIRMLFGKKNHGDLLEIHPEDGDGVPLPKWTVNPRALLDNVFEKAEDMRRAPKRKVLQNTSPLLAPIHEALLQKETYKNYTIILDPNHDPCPEYAATTKIPQFLANALYAGTRSKKQAYARSGRKLVVSRVLAGAPPFAKPIMKKERVLILLDFSSSMDRWLVPMLTVVVKNASQAEFDVMAYSASSKEFLIHLIYSHKHLSHAVHHYDGNADCVAFFLAAHLEADYDKIVIIGDMAFIGPSPLSADALQERSEEELTRLLRNRAVSVLAPAVNGHGCHVVARFKKNPDNKDRFFLFTDAGNLQETLQSILSTSVG